MALFKRSVGAILLVTLMPQLTGCTFPMRRRVALSDLKPEELGAPPDVFLRRCVGVSVSGGTVLTFDTVPPSRVTPTSVLAHVSGSLYVIPRSTITQVWVAGPVGRARAVTTSDIDSALAAPWPTKTSPVGVTVRGGTVVAFDSGSAVFSHDTLYASVRSTPVRIALADVQRVTVVRGGLSLGFGGGKL